MESTFADKSRERQPRIEPLLGNVERAARIERLFVFSGEAQRRRAVRKRVTLRRGESSADRSALVGDGIPADLRCRAGAALNHATAAIVEKSALGSGALACLRDAACSLLAAISDAAIPAGPTGAAVEDASTPIIELAALHFSGGTSERHALSALTGCSETAARVPITGPAVDHPRAAIAMEAAFVPRARASPLGAALDADARR